MIVVKLSGGIGNQMFQYAFGRQIAYIHKTKLTLDISFFQSQELRNFGLNVFNFEPSILTQKEHNTFELPSAPTFFNKVVYKASRLFCKNSIVKEPHFSFSPEMLEIPSRAYVEGYFQSEKYFVGIKEIIKNDFTFILPMSPENLNMFGLITNSNAVSIHIRRGDYVLNPTVNNIHGTCDIDYYLRAIKYISNKVRDAVFFIFSDDIEWVKKNIKITKIKYYIDFNSSDKSFEDMRLMSCCKHNIIANSSFSWWGAWLNKNSDKIVIAPEKWFNDSSKNTKDLIPEAWIRM